MMPPWSLRVLAALGGIILMQYKVSSHPLLLTGRCGVYPMGSWTIWESYHLCEQAPEEHGKIKLPIEKTGLVFSKFLIQQICARSNNGMLAFNS